MLLFYKILHSINRNHIHFIYILWYDYHIIDTHYSVENEYEEIYKKFYPH